MFFTVLTYLVIGLLTVFGLFYIGLEVRFFRALGIVRLGKSDVEPKPHVSVLISARNESAGIRGTLDSVLAQDYAGEWEVWVVVPTIPRKSSRNMPPGIRVCMCSPSTKSPRG